MYIKKALSLLQVAQAPALSTLAVCVCACVRVRVRVCVYAHTHTYKHLHYLLWPPLARCRPLQLRRSLAHRSQQQQPLQQH